MKSQEKKPRNVKNNSIVMIVSYAVILIGIVAIAVQIPRCIANDRQLRMTEALINECDTTMKKIEELEQENQILNDEVDKNITRIYDRVCEIEKDHPDEIRGKVIKSVKQNMKLDETTRKASVLALLNNYKELNDDTEVQVYLNANANIMMEIDKNLILIDDSIAILEQCSDKMSSINETDCVGD